MARPESNPSSTQELLSKLRKVYGSSPKPVVFNRRTATPAEIKRAMDGKR